MQASPLDFIAFVALVALLYLVACWVLYRRESLRPFFLIVGIALIVLLLPAYWWTERQGREASNRVLQQLEGIVPTYALELAEAGHELITLETELDDPTYLSLIEKQKAWLRLNKVVSDIYTFRRAVDDGGKLQFIVDSETDYDSDGKYGGEAESRTPVGEYWPDGFNREPIDQGFAGEVVTVDSVAFQDRWGTWISVYSPIYDSAGHIEAMVGVDFPASDWDRSIRSARLSVLARMVSIATLLIGGTALVSSLRSRLLVERRITRELEIANQHALLAVDRAKKAEAAKSQFLANMSHEIRTPMNGVIGMCQLLGNSGLNQEQSGYQQLALKSARDLLALLNDILDFSKMEAGKLELQIESIDLHELLSDTTRLLSAPAAEKELELILRITADVPKFVKTDATRLRQVIFNLIGNAVKFTEAGEVELSLTIDETSDHDAKRVRFSVRDTGIGISEIEQTRIFESFEQVTTGGEHHRGGTGLGLAISKRILELFGAELNVQSEPGRGSTFSFEIAMEVMPNLVEHDPTMDHLNEKTVLIVDDNQTSRRYFREVATSMGMRAEVATDGAKAVNVIATRTHQNQPFDLLMIDDGLDGIGIEEILQALSESGAPQSSVLLLTTVDRTSSLSPQASKTVNRVLMKPMSRDELTSAMLAAVAPKLGLTMEDLVAASTSTLETARQAKRVLLAEDNAINRAIVFNLLTDRGHSVDVVADGNAVLRRVARTTYDVVLMDIQMPKLDGLRTTELIREQERRSEKARHLPVFALTAQAMDGVEDRCIQVGMDGYLSKPVDQEELYRVVENCDLIVAEGMFRQVNARHSTTVDELGEATELREPSGTQSSIDLSNEVTSAPSQSHEIEFDPELFSRNTGGNSTTIRQMVELFQTESAKQFSELTLAIAEGELTHASQARHKLKGTLGIFGASRAIEALHRCSEIDSAGETASQRLGELESELIRLGDALDRWYADQAEST